MLSIQQATQEIQNTRMVIVLIAISTMIFWRALLHALLVIIVLAACVGAFVLLFGVRP